jgi:hypothetical protein
VASQDESWGEATHSDTGMLHAAIPCAAFSFGMAKQAASTLIATKQRTSVSGYKSPAVQAGLVDKSSAQLAGAQCDRAIECRG